MLAFGRDAISYGVYLFDTITLKIAVHYFAPAESLGDSILLTGSVLAASIAVAAPLYWLAELPMIAVGKRVRAALDASARRIAELSPASPAES